MPDFVKNKIKFDTEPTEAEIAAGVEEIKQDTAQGKGLVQTLKENEAKIHAYADARGLPFNLQNTMLANSDFKPGDGVAVQFGNSNYADSIPIQNLEKNTAAILSGDMMTAQQQMAEERGTPKVTMDDLPAVEKAETKPVIIQKGGDTNTASVQQKTDVHSGSLDTGIDSYHDRAAFNYT